MEQVEIHIREQLDRNWSDCLGGLAVRHQHSETVLTGSVRDQSALYGLLFKLSDMGIHLISLTANDMSPENSNCKQ